MSEAALVLAAGRDRSLRRHHPWIYAGAIARVEGEPAAGDTVLVLSAAREPLARAAYSPQSRIRARIWTFDARERVDAAFIARRMEAAIALRARLALSQHTNALRLVHGESDRLPGLIVDRYDDVLVVQFLSAGAERWRETVLDTLAAATGCTAIYERSEASVRALEGLPPRAGFVRGQRDARRCPIVEYGLHFRVDVAEGQKTGFFLDQRENRQRVRALAADRAVLDAFCYTGGFAIAALAGGARRVLAVESSSAALAVARENLAVNGLEAAPASFVHADSFAHLRRLCAAGERFDLVVLDPPKLAPAAAHLRAAARAYKDINLLAFRLLAPGGLLATFSCSGAVSPALFQSIVAGAARDAGVDARILERLGAAADHPVALEFPEGEYLKGLLVVRL